MRDRPRRPRAFLLGLAAAGLGAALMLQGLWIPAKAVLAQALLQRAFERTLASAAPQKPWPWADVRATARIEVPRLRRSAVVLDGVSGEAMAFGPGHVEGTPQAGEAGTAVYAAHRDTHFAFLGELRAGDIIDVIRADGRRARFRVATSYVARWDASGLDARVAGSHLALTTCWPLDGRFRGPLRYVVVASAEPGQLAAAHFR